MKYAIVSGQTTTEFSSFESASLYAIEQNIDSGSILSIQEDGVETSSLSTSSYEYFRMVLKQGYPIPNTPYYLAMQDSDRAQFSSMLILTRELLDAGYINTNTSQSIKTIDEQIIYLTTGEFKMMMIGYGLYYKYLWDQCDPKSIPP